MTMGLDAADARTRRAVEGSRSEASASMTSADEDDRIGRERSVTRPRVDDDDDDGFGASRVFERLARARGPARAIEDVRDIARAEFFRATSRDGA
jgi:hypothetical protein